MPQDSAPAGLPLQARRWLLPLLVAVWIGSSAAGLWVLWDWDNKPGASAQARAQWPADSVLARDRGRPTLVMLVHPQCTCSRASLTELAELLARARPRPKTFVLFLKPAGIRRRMGTDRSLADGGRPARRDRRFATTRARSGAVRRGHVGPDLPLRRARRAASSAAASPARARTPATTPDGSAVVDAAERHRRAGGAADQRVRLSLVRSRRAADLLT